MRTKHITTALLALCCLAAGVTGTSAASQETRKIAEAHQDAVVNVQLVIETTSSYEGESSKRETKVSATGTVIDPSGLVVASLAETNPTEMYRKLMDQEDEGFKMSSRTVGAKIRTSDGTEIPADVVLRDPDLDLAFYRPQKAPQAPMAYVDLSQSENPQLLDELLILCRMGPVTNRALAANMDVVRAVVTKPRTFFVVTPYINSSLGGPAFTLSGKAAGILVLRMSANSDSDSMGSSGVDDYMTAVVLPCSTVSGIAEQAKKATPIKESPAPATPAKPAAKKPAAKGK